MKSGEMVMERLNAVMRFFLYVLIFWLPYSPAVVEVCVILCFILFILKRIMGFVIFRPRGNPFKEQALFFLKSFRLADSPLNLPIAIFLAVCVLSLMRVSFSPGNSLSMRGFFTKTLEWFIIYFLVLEVFTERKHFFIALSVYLFTAFSSAIDSFVQYFITGKDIFYGRELARGGATAAFHHANGLAGYLTMAIPVSLALLINRMKKGKGVFWAGCIFATLCFSFILTFSRSAFGAMMAGLSVFLFYIRKKWLAVFWIVLFLSIAAVFSLPGQVKGKYRLNIDNIRGMAGWRLGIWQDSMKMVKERPVLGHGLNTYMRLFQNYRRKYQGHHDYDPTYAHNCFVQLWVELGTLGLMSFLWLIGSIFWHLKKAFFSTDGEDVLKIFLLGWAVGIFSFLFHSFFDTNLYGLQLSVYFWLNVGIAMALARQGRPLLSQTRKGE